MSDETPVSPTGTPLIPPRVFMWLALVVGAALAALGALVGIYPEVHGFQVALAVVSAVAGVLGIASPGIRKQVIVLLAVSAVFSASGCSWLKPSVQAELVKCGTGAMSDAVAGVMPDVVDAIQGSAVDWDRRLDAVVARAGGAALCAILALLGQLEDGAGPTTEAHVYVEAQGLNPHTVQARLYHYVDSRKLADRVAP